MIDCKTFTTAALLISWMGTSASFAMEEDKQEQEAFSPRTGRHSPTPPHDRIDMGLEQVQQFLSVVVPQLQCDKKAAEGKVKELSAELKAREEEAKRKEEETKRKEEEEKTARDREELRRLREQTERDQQAIEKENQRQKEAEEIRFKLEEARQKAAIAEKERQAAEAQRQVADEQARQAAQKLQQQAEEAEKAERARQAAAIEAQRQANKPSLGAAVVGVGLGGGRSAERVNHNFDVESARAVQGVGNLLQGKPWKNRKKKKGT